jgi:hypothetical protein
LRKAKEVKLWLYQRRKHPDPKNVCAGLMTIFLLPILSTASVVKLLCPIAFVRGVAIIKGDNI